MKEEDVKDGMTVIYYHQGQGHVLTVSGRPSDGQVLVLTGAGQERLYLVEELEPFDPKAVDADLATMDIGELREEARRLRAGVRRHRDCSGHDLCWLHPELWSLLPERTDPLPAVPGRREFIRRCELYRDSLGAEPHLEMDPLLSTLGMSEMEQAAGRMLAHANKAGLHLLDVTFSLEHMGNEGERTGLLHLLLGGLLELRAYPQAKGEFFATRELVDRLRTRSESRGYDLGAAVAPRP